MKITVFGATGGTGEHLVRQACESGYHVTAVVRDPARLRYRHPNLSVVRADVMDPEAISEAVTGADAVLNAIGTRKVRVPTSAQSDSTESIIKAMSGHGARRLLVVSSSGMVSEGDGPFTRIVVKPILKRVLRHVFADARRMEELVRGSDLDWTIVRAPRLTDGPRTGGYRMAVERNVRGGFWVSRADVADCLLRCLDDPATIRIAVTVAS